VKNVMRSVAGAALSALVGLSMTGAASAGPMSFSSGSAISAALPAQVEEVHYYRRHVHYYRHWLWGLVAQRGHGGRRPGRAGPEDYRLCISKNAPSLQGIGHADVA
jgi:hypothetical protein